MEGSVKEAGWLELRVLRMWFKFSLRDTGTGSRFKKVNNGPKVEKAESLTCLGNSLFEETCLKLQSLRGEGRRQGQLDQ